MQPRQIRHACWALMMLLTDPTQTCSCRTLFILTTDTTQTNQTCSFGALFILTTDTITTETNQTCAC